MNAIVPASRTDMSLAEIERLGDAIAKSNLFGIKTREQAITLMAIAQAEGRHPALAARDYDVIQGRPSKKAEAMMRDFLEAGGMVEWHALTDEEADATFSHPQGGKARINWNMARAEKAALKTKDNWRKFPRQMLRSRVVSEGVRTVWPLATSGMYVPEEAADIPAEKPVRHAGQTIDHEPAPKPDLTREPELEADTGGNGDDAAPESQLWLGIHTARLEGEQDIGKWLTLYEDACATASAEADLVRLHGIDVIKRAMERAPEAVKRRMTKASTAAFARLVPLPDAEVEQEPAP